MKVLFVFSGNHSFKISPAIKAQIVSLLNLGVEIDYFSIIGKGFWGYIKNIKPLSKTLGTNNYDIIHAHYGYSGIVSLFAKKKEKLIVSFMGSDIVKSNHSNGSITFRNRFILWLNAFFACFFYDHTIVKSEEMSKDLWPGSKVSIFPNGVNLLQFKVIDKNIARNTLKIPKEKRLVIFVSNPSRVEKNFNLAKEAIGSFGDYSVQLSCIYNVSQELLQLYYCATDLLLLTSYHEGSPNVIKEAMVCNCPIVSTDVGDVRWILGDTDGCFITSFNAKEVARNIDLALHFAETKNRTNGRQRIINLGLDSDTVANRIIEVYSKVLN